MAATPKARATGRRAALVGLDLDDELAWARRAPTRCRRTNPGHVGPTEPRRKTTAPVVARNLLLQGAGPSPPARRAPASLPRAAAPSPPPSEPRTVESCESHEHPPRSRTTPLARTGRRALAPRAAKGRCRTIRRAVLTSGAPHDYIDDVRERPAGTLHVAIGMSPKARGRHPQARSRRRARPPRRGPYTHRRRHPRRERRLPRHGRRTPMFATERVGFQRPGAVSRCSPRPATRRAAPPRRPSSRIDEEAPSVTVEGRASPARRRCCRITASARGRWSPALAAGAHRLEGGRSASAVRSISTSRARPRSPRRARRGTSTSCPRPSTPPRCST